MYTSWIQTCKEYQDMNLHPPNRFFRIEYYILTHCILNRLFHTTYWKSPISFRYIRLWDLHIPREKWLNYLQTVEETLIRRRVLHCLPITPLRVPRIQWVNPKNSFILSQEKKSLTAVIFFYKFAFMGPGTRKVQNSCIPNANHAFSLGLMVIHFVAS